MHGEHHSGEAVTDINPRIDGGKGQLTTDKGGGEADDPLEIAKTTQRGDKR